MKTLTPGEIALYCDVHQRTVSRWIASGQLKGFKLPGRGNYRVVLSDFLEFLHRQKIPVPQSLTEKPSILVVDDEAAYRRAIQRTLHNAGYEVTQASDGFQAGALLLQLKPALMTLDLQMPGLDGFEVLKFIRQQQDLQYLKVLVISGLDTVALQKALDHGANAVLEKPFDNAALVKTVSSVLNTSETTEQHG